MGDSMKVKLAILGADKGLANALIYLLYMNGCHVELVSVDDEKPSAEDIIKEHEKMKCHPEDFELNQVAPEHQEAWKSERKDSWLSQPIAKPLLKRHGGFNVRGFNRNF